MLKLTRWCIAHRSRVVVAWVAVAVITTGRSSWTTVSAVGEMVRRSGTRLESAVLIGADNTDESLGVT